jgi:hypothetical protein
MRQTASQRPGGRRLPAALTVPWLVSRGVEI